MPLTATGPAPEAGVPGEPSPLLGAWPACLSPLCAAPGQAPGRSIIRNHCRYFYVQTIGPGEGSSASVLSAKNGVGTPRASAAGEVPFFLGSWKVDRAMGGSQRGPPAVCEVLSPVASSPGRHCSAHGPPLVAWLTGHVISTRRGHPAAPRRALGPATAALGGKGRGSEPDRRRSAWARPGLWTRASLWRDAPFVCLPSGGAGRGRPRVGGLGCAHEVHVST